MNSTVCIPMWAIQATALIVASLLIMKLAFPFRLFIAAHAAGAPIPALHLVGMRLRRTDPRVVVEPYIMSVKAGLRLQLDELEAHHLAGGDVGALVEELIRADKSGTPTTFAEVAGAQLRQLGRR